MLHNKLVTSSFYPLHYLRIRSSSYFKPRLPLFKKIINEKEEDGRNSDYHVSAWGIFMEVYLYLLCTLGILSENEQ